MPKSRSLREALRGPALGSAVAGVLGIATLPAPAQDAAAPGLRGIAFVPTLSLGEAYTDNRFLTATDRQASLITQVSPGLRLTARTGRVQGDLDYSLNAYRYSHGSGENDLQNSLDARLHAEAVENLAFIDASARVAQQSISALGTQTPDPSLQNANQSEVGTYSVSPFVRGSFAGVANYELRGSYELVRSDAFDAANSRTNGASFKVQSDPSAGTRLRPGLTALHQGASYDAARSTATDRIVANLDFAATPELLLTVSGGRESSNLTSLDKQGSTNWGYGIDWRPSERTRASYSSEKRSFGDSHSGLVEFRTPRTVWRYVDNQSVTTSAGTGVGSTQTAYDLLFTQFASLYPDPTLRAQMVDATLASNGIDRGTLVNGGFLTTGASLQRRQEASVALTGPRTTAILSAFQIRTSALGTSTQLVQDDLSTQGTIRQRGLGATLSHRLTPESTANVYFSLLRTGAVATSVETNQRTLTLGWSTRLGPHTHLSLSARRSAFSSTLAPYHESALIAGLGFQF